MIEQAAETYFIFMGLIALFSIIAGACWLWVKILERRDRRRCIPLRRAL